MNQVLVPLLGPGILQAVSCGTVNRDGTCSLPAGATSVNLSTVFRIGTDGLTAPLPVPSATLPQPFLPGIGANIKAGDSTVLDPEFRPAATDNIDFTIQREISRNVYVEVGYIGRRIRNEYQLINLDAIPHMTTLGGSSSHRLIRMSTWRLDLWLLRLLVRPTRSRLSRSSRRCLADQAQPTAIS